MSFWPDELNVDDLRTPSELLRMAGDELESKTHPLLKVNVFESRLSDRLVLQFEVTAADGSSVNLFEVSQQLDLPYPAAFTPPTSEIPEFLKRKRFVPGKKSPLLESIEAVSSIQAAAPFIATHGKYVENEWVAGSPQEFSDHLKSLLGRDDIVARIIKLATQARTSTEGVSTDSKKAE